MDNPYYFYQDPRLPLQPSLVLATLKVNDSEARKALDQNLGMLNSRLESPSLKLVKRCSLRKFFGKNSKLKRSQSLTHEKDSNFAVERSMPPSKSSGNTSASYVLPRPLKKFKIWSATDGVKSHEKILLFLNDKIQSSDLDKVQVTIEVLQDSIPRQRVSPESVALVNESSLEIMLPEINGNGIKLSLEIGKFDTLFFDFEEIIKQKSGFYSVAIYIINPQICVCVRTDISETT